MKRVVFLLFTLVVILPPTEAAVVRPAPDFSWVDSSGKRQSLKSLKGRAVILIIAPSPQSRAFRSQIGQLHKLYERMAANKVVCVAAFTETPGIIKSNIPFALAADGVQTGANYDVGKFAIAIIGRDGNLDCISGSVIPGQRVFDLLGNSFAVQETLRRP